MKLKSLGFSIVLLLVSCESTDNITETAAEIPDAQLSMEELIDRKVRVSLGILGTEKFTTQIERAHLNTDDIEDAIVLVNRKEFAVQKAVEMDKVAYHEKIQYFGNHNHLFFYDGSTHTVTRNIAIPSSAFIPLRLEFQNIQSEAFKDFTIDVRIQESCWRNFYTIRNGVPALVFQWKLWEKTADGSLKANHFKFDNGSYSLAKDILIFDANIVSKVPDDLSINFSIKTEPKGEILHRFFYYPKEKKYFTNK